MSYIFLIANLFLALTNANLHDAPSNKVHNFHASYGRMAVDGTKAYMKIRLFTDDLRDGMRRFYRNQSLEIAPNSDTESKFQTYLNQKFVFNSGSRRIAGKVLNCSKEDDMTAFVVEYTSTRNIASFYVRYAILMEAFDDQRNIFKVIKAPSEVEQSYLFVVGSDSQLVTF
jgi:hypothetical protein